MIMETVDLKAMDGVDDLIRNTEEEDRPEEVENETYMDFAQSKIDRGFHVFPASGSSTIEYPKYYKKREEMGIQDVMKDQALSFLPAKALFRFKSVCKEWRKRISSPFLAHSQSLSFKHISGLFCQSPGVRPFFVSLEDPAYGVPNESLGFFPERVTLRAAANGLLFCSSTSEDRTDYFVCNPASQEWKKLPRPHFYHGPRSALALAFEPSPLSFVARFSLVCAFPIPGSPFTFFETYCSETDSWRSPEVFCSELDGEDLSGDGVFFNGSVFWQTKTRAVLGYNPASDQYGLFSLPPRTRYRGCLAVMGGELCYIRPSREVAEEKEEDEVKFDFVMEVYRDCSMRLKQRIPLDLGALGLHGDEMLRALGCVNDDVLLFAVGYRLCGYHVKERKVEVISVRVSSYINDMKFLPYVNSLVPLA